MDREKVANNILELMLDPTRVPVRQRLYFGPEEILDNEVYERSKLQGLQAYRGQRYNSDFYPIRNRTQINQEVPGMDRRTLIASFDILSQQFKEDTHISKDLRTMAYAASQMSDEELQSKLADVSVEAKKKVKMIKCPQCGANVMEQTGYCLACKKKIKDMKGGKDKGKKKANDQIDEGWSEAAERAVLAALVSDVTGAGCAPENKEESEDEGKEAAQKMVELPDPSKVSRLMNTMRQQGLIEAGASVGEVISAIIEMITSDNSLMKRLVKFIGKGAEPTEKGAKEEPSTEVDHEEEINGKKNAGAIKGPGIPDGTGPHGGTPACPMTKKDEEEKSSKDYETEPGRQPQEEGDIEEKHAEEVDTDVLAGESSTIEGIEFSGSDNVDLTELSSDEANRLASVFGFNPDMTPDEKDRYDQLLGK